MEKAKSFDGNRVSGEDSSAKRVEKFFPWFRSQLMNVSGDILRKGVPVSISGIQFLRQL
jgi:hypothetical protein